jgi:hypothetical protein
MTENSNKDLRIFSMVAGAERPMNDDLVWKRPYSRTEEFHYSYNTARLLKTLLYTCWGGEPATKKVSSLTGKIVMLLKRGNILTDVELDSSSLDEVYEDEQSFESHSGNLGTQWSAEPESGREKATVTEFATSTMTETVGLDYHVDSLRGDGLSADVSLKEFLSRPIRIFEREWAINDFLREEIDPWSLYLENPLIENKTANYAWFRGNLHIKLVINGTQWHYGRGLLSYRPRERGLERIRTPGGAPVIDNLVYSQRPHITFDPTDCTGGDLFLPFCCPTNWLALDSLPEKQAMGRLILSSFNALRIATASTTAPVTISIFAWMSEVEMCGSTNFVSQSGDEYGQGVISKPASALARFAGHLTNVPVIGRFALATQIGADMTGRIASLFGYCRPVNVDPVTKFKPAFAGNIANTSIEEATDKLTFDPKQELSIDPKLTGYDPGEDELMIRNIAKRRSLLTRADWRTADAVDSLIFNSQVTCGLFEKSDFAGNIELAMTPMHFAAYPFEYWRGAIEFTFEIAASQYHKGRLRFNYDPIGFNSTVPEWVAGFNRIIDLSKERKFKVRIPWNQNLSYLRVPHFTAADPPLAHSPANDDPSVVAPVFGTTNAANGVVSIWVLNKLTVPNAPAGESIQINVFVNACEDFEVAAPEDNLNSLQYFQTEVPEENFEGQSGFISQSGDESPEDQNVSTEHVETSAVLPTVEYPESSLVHFGETFMSFRSLLKRYNYHSALQYTANGTVGAYLHRTYWTDFPRYIGPDPSAPFYFAKMTLMNYLTPAFVCRRGGIRWKHVRVRLPMQVNNTNDVLLNPLDFNGTFTVCREDPNFTVPTQAISRSVEVSGNLNTTELTRNRAITWKGAYTTPVNQQPVAEIEVPYYTNLRFASARTIAAAEPPGQINEFKHFTEELLYEGPVGYGAVIRQEFMPIVESYVSAGEDFSLSWFLNVPICEWRENNPWL